MNSTADIHAPDSLFSRIVNNSMLLMCASVALFSVSILLIKVASARYDVSTWAITLVRFTIGTVSVLVLFRGEQRVTLGSFLKPLVIVRGVIGGLGVLWYNLCIAELGAGRATILSASFPIFATLLARPLLGEAISARRLIYSAMAISGIALMTGLKNLSGPVNPYDLLAITVAILSGLIVVIIRKLHQTENTATIFASQCVFGLLICAPALLVSFERPSLFGSLTVVGSSILIVLGQLSMTHAFKTINVSLGSSIHLAGPVVVTALSFAFLGERMGAWDAIGAAVILLACFKIIRQRR